MPDDPRQPDPRDPAAKARAPKPGSPAWLAWIEQDRIEQDRIEQDAGMLSDADRAAMARALAEDPELRAQVEGMRADRAMLRALASPTAADAIEPPPDLMERIELALERDALLNTPAAEAQSHRHAPHTQPPLPRRHAPFRPRRRAGRWIAPTIALAFIAASLWLVIERPLDPRAPISPGTPTPLALAPERDAATSLRRSEREPEPEPIAALAQLDAQLEVKLDAQLDRGLAAPIDTDRGSAPARAPLDALALRQDLERLLAQDDAELRAARLALAEAYPDLPPAAPVAPGPTVAAAAAPSVLDPAQAAALARDGRLAVAVRSDRPAELHRTLAALARPGLEPVAESGVLATLRPLRDRRAIAAFPPELAQPPEIFLSPPWLDLNDAIARTGRDGQPEPEIRTWTPRPQHFDAPEAHAAFAYFQLDIQPNAASLEALRAELVRALRQAHPDAAELSVVIEFVELPEALPLHRPEPDPLWWLDRDAWRPKTVLPVILTDDNRP